LQVSRHAAAHDPQTNKPYFHNFLSSVIRCLIPA
jgi:hypothetical protein